MAQSLVQVYTHIVFSTKYRQELIFPPFEEELHRYIGGLCKEFKSQPLTIGGHTDHVHILCALSKNIPLTKLLEEVKSHSSKWFKTKKDELSNFYWQSGYGAFSVSPEKVDRVRTYIENQHEHHKKQNFVEEFKGLLVKHEIDFDERYLWD